MGRHSRRGRPNTGKPTTTAAGRPPVVQPVVQEEAPRPHPAPAPAQEVPQGVPHHGAPVYAGADARAVPPPYGAPRVRGGHPEHREPGGAWGIPPQRGPVPDAARGPAGGPPQGVVHGAGRMPRQEYIDAFDDDVFAAAGRRTPVTGPPAGEYGAGGVAAPPAPGEPREAEPRTVRDGGSERNSERNEETGAGAGGDAGAGSPGTAGGSRKDRGGRGRTFTGITAAAVTTVLAVVVAGQVTDARSGAEGLPGAGGENERMSAQDSSRSDARPTPSKASAPPASTAPVSYAERMDRLFDLSPDFKGTGRLVPVPGRDGAPGRGPVVRYRVDVEEGLPLDGRLFAEAVHRTLNDERSWSHGGARTFERVSGGDADFVITLAGPATTAEWCARSGLDTTIDNVSCDSAATERVMINAYRWARGAETFGPERMREYREMLINHEVGHRLGMGHVGCPEDGALAPVMMQQTKYLTTGGATCRPNAWPFPDA